MACARATLHDGQVIEEQTTSSLFHTLGEPEVSAEVERYGLSCASVAEGMLRLRRA